jgi:hypothetical protein
LTMIPAAGRPVVIGERYIDLDLDVVATILSTMIEGWRYARRSPDVHTEAPEVPMTERFRDGMREALRAAGLRSLVVLPGTESRSSPARATPNGRTDIPIFCIEVFLRAAEHDPHAIIECKRVAGGDATLCREYVVNGIDRFRSGLYAASHAAGFMAGYVISGEAAAVVHSVNGYLTRQQRSAERLDPSSVLPVSALWQSHHDRRESAPIALHHTFLSVAAE